jgi:hypothetical protein
MSEIELQSQRAPSGLSRDLLPDILAAVNQPGAQGVGSWNVVDALELLLDAGHYRTARALAQMVQHLMGGDGRERLFLAYGTLCEIMIDGVFAGHVPRLEALCQQIATGNHSIADKIRARLVYARALVLGASTSSLRESDLLKARSILNEEFYRAMSHSEAHLACLIGLELARSYLLCSPHEVVVLTALVSHIRDVLSHAAWMWLTRAGPLRGRRRCCFSKRAASHRVSSRSFTPKDWSAWPRKLTAKLHAVLLRLHTRPRQTGAATGLC